MPANRAVSGFLVSRCPQVIKSELCQLAFKSTSCLSLATLPTLHFGRRAIVLPLD